MLGKKRLKFVVFVTLIAGLSVAASPAHAQGAEPYGLDAIVAFDRLSYLKLDTMAGGASSYQRNGENKDGDNNWKYFDGDERVMFEAEGPGVIYRMWFTGYQPWITDFKIYFDGEETPRIDFDVANMQTNGTPPFIRPLIRDWLESSGGHPTYVPIPFNESIKVVSRSPLMRLFYNINYHLFSPDRTVQTWTGTEDRTAANLAWDQSQMTLDPKSDAGNVTASGTISVPAGGSETLLDAAGPRSVSSIKVRFGASIPTMAQLNNTRLRIHWDNEETPSVDAPLGSFFAMGEFGVGIRPQSLMVGLDNSNNLYCYFPMPFKQHAKVELHNAAGTTLSNVTYEVKHKPFAGSFDDVGYFKTQYNVGPSTPGRDLIFLDTEGTGQMVGVVQSVSGPQQRYHLEGDERFYVDGSRTPTIHGTGTEDFYNGGWYFNNGLMTWPVWGHTQRLAGTPDRSSMYRLFLQDAIPFRSSIRAGIEHGGHNEIQVDSWTLAYYYHRPARMELSDTLDVGNSASEAAHDYVTTGPTWVVSHNATFEGDFDDVIVAGGGRVIDGTSEFTLAINPDNEGVILRRMLDQNTFNQNARVYVDNAFVGNFLTAGGNRVHRWKDADFMIPESVTSGKSEIRVRIEPQLTHFGIVPDQLFFDGFESGGFAEGGWVNGGATVGTGFLFGGAYVATFNQNNYLIKALDTTGYEDIEFSYYRRIRNFTVGGNNEWFVEWSPDGGASWNLLEQRSTNEGYQFFRFTLPAAADNNSNVQVRFRLDTQSNTNKFAHLDDVFIGGRSMDPTPTNYWNEFSYSTYSILPPPPLPAGSIAITTNHGYDFITSFPVSLYGTTSPDTVEILLNGEPIAYTPGATHWSTPLELVEGPNVLTVVAINDLAVESEPATIVITLDTSELPVTLGAVLLMILCLCALGLRKVRRPVRL